MLPGGRSELVLGVNENAFRPSRELPVTGSFAQFSLRVLIAIALVVCALLIWQLQSVLLLIFAAVVVAVVLDAFGNALRKLAPVPEGVSRLLVGILIASVLIGAALLFGRQISTQLSQLGDTLPPAWENFVDWAGPDRVESVIDDFAPDGTSLASMVQTMFGALTDALSGLVVAVLGGVYIAINPKTYHKGAIRLLPQRARDRVDAASRKTGKALRDWLLAQLISMLATFLVVYIGLTLLGVPSALALAILAGLFEFVPLLGPVLGAIPAVLIAGTVGIDTALWTIGFFIVWQQIEGNAVAPLAMKFAVEIPPAVTLFCLLIFGVLFGLPGLLLGGPLTVVLWMTIKTLWVEPRASG
ncbi:AI-2E family transporter [Qipengyuania pacifica]|uniref:AI-2E family transporter n=1 Tax=Qipengyuania pacifica TaxID=2860199 RepID=UPI001FFCDAFD|nr:AI-2E family transporter [Qipengyuania aerophila]